MRTSRTLAQVQRVFALDAKARQRARAASRADASEYDYLRDELASRLVERLGDVARDIPRALDLGANTGNVLKQLLAQRGSSGRTPGGIERLHMLEPSGELSAVPPRPAPRGRGGGARALAARAPPPHPAPPRRAAGAMLRRDAATLWPAARAQGLAVEPLEGPLEGAALPFADASLDIVLSSCALHWVNDVPGAFAEVRRVLRPDGVFVFALLGGETLQELRCGGGGGAPLL